MPILQKILGFPPINTLSIKGLTARGSCTNKKKFSNVDELVEYHFLKYSDQNHICRDTLHLALLNLNHKPSLIIETGSSAWGTNSSLLFDSYVNSFGGQFITVDIRIEPLVKLKKLCSPNTLLNCDDSINFINKWVANNRNVSIDLLYLDSWDVNWKDPNPSEIHGIAEFLAASNNLSEGSMLLVDDTPLDPSLFLGSAEHKSQFIQYFEKSGFYPGKGSLIKPILTSINRGYVLKHAYQLLWKF
jgi:hypothetical protein